MIVLSVNKNEPEMMKDQTSDAHTIGSSSASWLENKSVPWKAADLMWTLKFEEKN